MTEDEKLQSLLDDTADVAPEDRIYITEALAGESMMAEEKTAPVDYNSPAEQPEIKFPSVNINDIDQVREYMKRYVGMPVYIKSDGRTATFTSRGNRSSLKRKGRNLVAVESLDTVIESSYPVGWVTGDTKKSMKEFLGSMFTHQLLFCCARTAEHFHVWPKSFLMM